MIRLSLFPLAALSLLALVLCGCRGGAPRPAPIASATPPSTQSALQRFDFKSAHMGTLFTISLFASSQELAEAAADSAFRRIAQLEEIMSDYQADSELMRLCDQPANTPVPVSQDLFDVLVKAEHFSEISNGAFDVTVGPYVRLWRFSRKRKTLPNAAELAEARQSVGWQHLRLNSSTRTVTLLVPKMRLDLGGIAKGYAADEALKILKTASIDRALVAASGDIAIGNPPPGQPGWRVGISSMDPTATNRPLCSLVLKNAGISTSGDLEQGIEINGVRYSHIISPKTGLGLTERIQVTMIGPNATTTDAMATTISVMGKEHGLKLVDSVPGVSALVATKEGGRFQVFPSGRFPKINLSK